MPILESRLRGPLDFLAFSTMMFIVCAVSIVIYETLGGKMFLLIFVSAMFLLGMLSWALHARQLRSDASR